jgi:hypothetical protein
MRCKVRARWAVSNVGGVNEVRGVSSMSEAGGTSEASGESEVGSESEMGGMRGSTIVNARKARRTAGTYIER